MGVLAAERGDVRRMQHWYILTFVLGAIFIGGQVFEYAHLIQAEGLTLSSSAYGSAFYLTTGFHGLHVIAGLVAFLFVLARSYASRRYGHEQATAAIVTSYYWHFVDVVWIALFFTIYVLQ
jgi:cytochrome c oxidase subunit 3